MSWWRDSPSQPQGAASLEFLPTFGAPHRRGDRIGGLLPVWAQSCRNRPFGECPLLREEQTSKICCLRSTSTGTRRVVRPSGWGVVNSLARRGCGPVAAELQMLRAAWFTARPAARKRVLAELTRADAQPT